MAARASSTVRERSTVLKGSNSDEAPTAKVLELVGTERFFDLM
jgi:hypothetical protein